MIQLVGTALQKPLERINLDSPVEALQKYFGYDSFKGKQLEAIEHLLAGNDFLFLAPTGLGKSIVYQLPAVMCKGTAIVISPLLALMQDQIHALEKKNIKCLTINSTLGVKDRKNAFKRLEQGDVKILFLAPETLLKSELVDFINTHVDISFIAVDELHCVSAWGMSFRPMYKQIGEVRQTFKKVPVISLTATADIETLNDAIKVLQYPEDVTVFRHSLDRSNITYSVIPKTSTFLNVYKIIAKYPPDTCGIIYARTREGTLTLESYLQSKGIHCKAFHAGMKVSEKKQIQEDYANKKLNLIIATIAFGMGIDRNDVRYVINSDMPGSIEEFSQMSGRASRDGKPADSYILYDPGDVKKIKFLLGYTIKNPVRLEINYKKLLKMQQLCASLTTCRRKSLVEYFGDTYHIQNCKSCDVCLKNNSN